MIRVFTPRMDDSNRTLMYYPDNYREFLKSFSGTEEMKAFSRHDPFPTFTRAVHRFIPENVMVEYTGGLDNGEYVVRLTYNGSSRSIQKLRKRINSSLEKR